MPFLSAASITIEPFGTIISTSSISMRTMFSGIVLVSVVIMQLPLPWIFYVQHNIQIHPKT